MKKFYVFLVVLLITSGLASAQCTVAITTTTNVSCFNGADGILCATANGGTGTYTYNWSTGAVGFCNPGLIAGTYTVTITDALSCTASASATITQPTQLTLSSLVTQPASCNIMGGGGSACMVFSGGTPPYTYIWSSGDIGSCISNLSQGTYYATVSDAMGCVAWGPNVNLWSFPIINVVSIQNTCSGASNGSITVAGSGSAAPYSFIWSNGATGPVVNNLAQGNYVVTITDALSCTTTTSINITGSLTTSQQNQMICAGENIQLHAGGAQNYLWSPAGSLSCSSCADPIANPMTTTTYTIEGSGGGCAGTTTTLLTVEVVLCSEIMNKAGVVFFDLNQNGIKDAGELPAVGAIIREGPAPYHYFTTDNNGVYKAYYQSGSYTLDRNVYPPGPLLQAGLTGTPSTHTLTGISDTTNDFALRSGDISIYLTATPPSCFGANNGSITATTIGGGPTMTYLWSNNATSQTINGLSPGIYYVTVTDNYGFSDSAHIVVTQPDPVVLNILSITNACFGLNNGKASIWASGGSAPFTYHWSSGVYGSNITGLAVGNYIITVTDPHGCMDTASVTITNNYTGPLAISPHDSIFCTSPSLGLTASPAMSYYWAPSASLSCNTCSNPTASPTATTTYTVTATAHAGCTTSASTTISVGLNPQITANPSQIWEGDSSIITATGGDHYFWSTGDTSQSIIVTPTVTTNYIVTVTAEDSGCSEADTITIIVLAVQHQLEKAGTVYHDLNNNGSRDPGEPPLPNCIILEDPIGYYFSTNDSGVYQAYYNNGSYTLSLGGIHQYCNSNPSTQTLTGLNDTTNDFGYYCMSMNNVLVMLSQTGAQPGFETYYYLHIHNIGGDTVNGRVCLNYDPQLTFVSTFPACLPQAGDSVVWEYSALLPGQSRNFQSRLYLPQTAQFGDTLFSTAVIYPVVGDTFPSNNYFSSARVITNAVDPNEKLVSPVSFTPDELLTEPELYYTVHFQNTGTDTAHRVVIRDSLSQMMLIPTLETVGASHPYTFNITPWGTAVWTFNNIMLPDSGADYEASQGYVMFMLKSKSTLSVGDTIKNEAAIYFDFNSAVITNTAKTAIVSILTGIIDIDHKSELQVYPNPSSGTLNIEFNSTPSPWLALRLFDLSGQVLYSEHLKSFSGKYLATINLINIPEGIYFVQVLTEKATLQKKVVLIK